MDRFQELLTGLLQVDLETAVARLDEAGYWPKDAWPLAKQRAHVRWMFAKIEDDAGRPRWKRRPDAARHRDLVSPERARALVALLRAFPDWVSLETIRRAALRTGSWFPPDSGEAQQVRWLERVLGTEEDPPDPALRDADGTELVCCVWDGLDRSDPEPVYKLFERLSWADARRVRDHREARRRWQQDAGRGRGG